jgi:hypothetical protein
MSRGRLVAMDRSSGRHSPMKAGGDAVQAETGVVRHGSMPLGRRGWIGRQGEGSRGGGAVHQCFQEENERTRDGIGRRLFMAAQRCSGRKRVGGSGLACGQVKGEEGGSGQQRHGRDGGGRQSGGALVRE